MALELRQPDGAVARRLIYFLRNHGIPKNRGFSNELFAAEELELSRRLRKLARETGRGMVILHRHPLVTSARKLRLYTMRDHLKLLVRVLFNRRALTCRESCTLWYDGRR